MTDLASKDESRVPDEDLAKLIRWSRGYLGRKQSVPLPIPTSEVQSHNFAIDLWSSITCALLELQAKRAAETAAPRPRSEYHEDHGPVLWWRFPIQEAPFVGTPLDDMWPKEDGYYTHWTPIPIPASPLQTGDCASG